MKIVERSQPMEILQRCGAIRRGHFIGRSGLHLDTYINKDDVYAYPREVRQLCVHLARPFVARSVDVVAGPVLGGIVLAQWTAAWLADWHDGMEDPRAIFAERGPDGRFGFCRGYDRLIPGRRVLLVDDVLTTGGSVRALARAVVACSGAVVGVAALVNRGRVSAESLGVPRLHSLLELDLVSWTGSECPLCRDGISVDPPLGVGRDVL